MPTYDYRCAENDRVVEVRHKMVHRVTTWGELCKMAGIDPGDTDDTTPVARLANGGNLVRSSSLKTMVPADCNPDACSGGMGCPITN